METANRSLENASLSRPPPPRPLPQSWKNGLPPSRLQLKACSQPPQICYENLFIHPKKKKKKPETNEPAWALTGNPRFQAGAELSGSPAR